MMGITNIHQSKVEIQGKKSPTKNEKKNIERERNNLFCMGKICIEWKRVVNL